MIVLDGKVVSQAVRKEIADQSRQFIAKMGRPPGLGVILVGEDPASQVYVRNKESACKDVGFYSRKVSLPASASEEEVLETIKDLNTDVSIDAFLLQMPVPKHLNAKALLDAIDPMKDADGLHPENMGLLWVGRGRVAPCTPWGVMRILSFYSIDPSGMRAVVVGRSQIVGRPMAHLLTEANATVSLCHTKTKDLASYTRTADLVVVAAGVPAFLGKDDFKQGSIVIDVGIHGSGQGKGLQGDVRYAELVGWAAAATPVPGGVGPMTITCLLENTLKLAQLKASLAR